MKIIISKHRHYITLTVVFLTVLINISCVFAFSKTELTRSYETSYKVQQEFVNDSIQSLELFYKNSINKGDTLIAIRTLNKLARVYSHKGNHKESYDKLWGALILADISKANLIKSSIYKEIGRHYSFFYRRDKALHFLNLSLNLKKEMVNSGQVAENLLVENYLAFVSTHREFKEFHLAEKYLDSCFLNYDKSKANSRWYFLKFEEAVILSSKGKDKEAIKLFNSIIPWFVKNQYSYQVLVYKYLGDSYKNIDNYVKSRFCYKKAIEISEFNASHKDFVPLVYEELSNLYFSKGKYLQAYNSIKKAKDLDAVFFDSRSVMNSSLLEIQDDFRKDKEEQVSLIQEQKLKRFEQEDKVAFLEKILLWGIVIFLILFGVVSFRSLRTKHRVEKKILRKERELERLKDGEVIELKNKELAASVLKLIEKDVFLEQIKDKLSSSNEDFKSQDLKKIINSITNRNYDNWNEFQARFVSINKSFYKKLEKDFPNLTMNDQKLCALIKLNFSSKDIAQLLNMSIESVHTTRSRLRKKLNITREVNLKQFISNI